MLLFCESFVNMTLLCILLIPGAWVWKSVGGNVSIVDVYFYLMLLFFSALEIEFGLIGLFFFFEREREKQGVEKAD